MATAKVRLELPAGPIIHSTDSVGDGDIVKDLGLLAELRTFGALHGQVYDVGFKDFVVPAGAPGTLDIDLSAATALDGSALVGLAGKTVMIAIRILSVNDAKAKVSAANAVEWMDGTTDGMNLFGFTYLVLHVENPGLTAFTPPDFDATHKKITVTSVGGCTGRVLIAVR